MIFNKRRLKKIKGFSLTQSTDEWLTLSRAKKRNATLIIYGKPVNILMHLENMARKLPVCKVVDTGEKVNHLEHLKWFYMESGIKGIERYLKHINKAI